MKVNGQEVTLKDEITLFDYLEQNNYSTTKIAVERNGDIVPKNMYNQVILTEADRLEIVSFVGGG